MITKIVKTYLLFRKYLLLMRQKYSHNGTFSINDLAANALIIKIFILRFCDGILYAFGLIPNFKRKIEMDNFEGKVNFNLLHTYLYVSYLDALNELNKIELKNQKNSYLKKLCSNSNFTNNLCLNLIMSENDLIQSFNDSLHSK